MRVVRLSQALRPLVSLSAHTFRLRAQNDSPLYTERLLTSALLRSTACHRPGEFLEALVAGDVDLAHDRADPHSRAHVVNIRHHVHIYVLIMQRIIDREQTAAARRKL